MSKKYILIVDDAKDILFLLMHSVKRLGPDYEVITASDGASAMEQLQKQKFDLVITDYMMPGLTGIDLVQAVRSVMPETPIVLMTAHDTRSVRDTVEALKLGGFIGKPFTVPEVLEVVNRALLQTHQPVETPAVTLPSLDVDRAVKEQLQILWNKTGAHCVLLVKADGTALKAVGETNAARINKFAAFVSANYQAAAHLANLLGEKDSIFKSSYHEGSKFNIYIYDVNAHIMLVIIFGVNSKPGSIWFYAKQTGAELGSLLEHVAAQTEAKDQGKSAATDFDTMFGRSVDRSG